MKNIPTNPHIQGLIDLLTTGVSVTDLRKNIRFTMSGEPHARPLVPHNQRLVRPAHAEDACLFKDGVDANDIVQGHYNTCYWLAALAFCAKRHPHLITRAIQQLGDNRYRVTLYNPVTKTPATCEIDGAVPVDAASGVPQCARSRNNNEQWVSLMEKALACLTVERDEFAEGDSRYELIEYGAAAVAMMHLCHGDAFSISAPDLVARALKEPSLLGEVCDELIAMMADGCGMFVAWHEDYRRVELIDHHAYSVLDIKDIEGVGYVFLLHNPFGKCEWTGELSDMDHGYDSSAAHAAFGMERLDDGKFLMPAAQLFARISKLDVFCPE